MSAQKTQLGFVEQALESLETALTYADGLVKTGVLPKHYYDQNGNPKQGSPQSVLLVIQMGREIGMSNLQAIQQIVPVNNTLSIKGDGAKALIMASKLCSKWVEEEFGSGEEWGVKITAKRSDTGEEKTSSFTIADAKRAGLWVSKEMAEKNERLKFGAWYKYPKRMIKYRALGFLCRDLFPDVLQGMVTLEEAEDYGRESARVETEEGITTNADTTKQERMVDSAIGKTAGSRSRGPNKVVKDPEPVQEAVVVEEKTQKDPEPAVTEGPAKSTPASEQPVMSFEEALKNIPEDKLMDFVGNNRNEVKSFLNRIMVSKGFSDLQEWLKMAGIEQFSIGKAVEVLKHLRFGAHQYEKMCVALVGKIIFPAPAEGPETPASGDNASSGAAPYKFDSRFVIPKEIPRGFDQELLIMDYVAMVNKSSADMRDFAVHNGFADENQFLTNASAELIDRFLVS